MAVIDSPDSTGVSTAQPSRGRGIASRSAWWRVHGALLVALVAVAALSLLVGDGDLSDAALRGSLLALRLNRLMAAGLAGAALGVAGVLVQGLLHNPLASPSVLGTTAGASLGGKLAILGLSVLPAHPSWPALAPELLLPLGCLCGALVALWLLLAVTRRTPDLVVVLLSGFLLSALLINLGGFVTSLAQERWELGRAVIRFALGDVSAAGPRHIAMAAPLVLGGGVFAWLWARPLDVLLTGEEEARSLGLDVKALRTWVVVWIGVLTAAAVAIGGNVGFVGLVIPHALRPLIGVQHGPLVPGSALLGAAFVVSCDIVCRLLPGQSEVPLGVVTGLVGAPAFLWLLTRYRRRLHAG